MVGTQLRHNIEVRLETEVARSTGIDHLVDRSTGEEEEANANWLFVFSGALPRTDWIGDHVARDAHGFVLTGAGRGGARRRGPEMPPCNQST